MEGFNPVERIFQKPEVGSPLMQDFEAMASGGLHNLAMFDQEGDAHGGEAVNPATGKPNENVQQTGMEELTEVVLQDDHQDILGDIRDPNSMSLEDFMKEFEAGKK